MPQQRQHGKGFVPTPGNTPSTTSGSTNVSYVRPEVDAALRTWGKITDCVIGDDAVKAKKDRYLPVPDADIGGTVNDGRYESYITRAVFYNVTGRTLQGLVGQVFGRETVIEMPKGLEALIEDAGGDDVGLEQQAKKTLEHTLSLGRAGLLADFPRTTGAVTKAQEESGEIRPVIRMYRPENIINWRTKRIGAKKVLSLVVLVETVDLEDDGFEVKTATAYRVLRLDKNNECTSQVFYENVQGDQVTVSEKDAEPVVIKDAAGKPFPFIPFTFVGSENNDAKIDPAPLAAMANLNIAHYRNSADYEDSCFITGQPTPVFSGLTEEWVNNVMKGKVYLGARGGVMLPKGGTAQLLQVNGNTMPKEAMEHKEKQMVALGAKLVEERSIRRTATEARQDEASETSILSSATKNVNNAYNRVIKWAQMFVSTKGTFVFTLNSDFDLSNMTPAERQQLVAEWQSEAITWKEMRTGLKRSRIAFEDDEEARDEIAENPPITVEEPEGDGDPSNKGDPVEGAGGE